MIQASDIVFYGSQNMNRGDSTTPQGGAIDSSIKVVFTDMTQLSRVDIFSSSAADTGNITIEGRRSTGSIVTETIGISGTGIVTTANEFARILRITSAAHVGTISFEVTDDGSGIGTMESGVDEIRRPFLSVTGDPVTGSTRTFYEKIFIKNNSVTNDYLSVSLIENFDGTEASGADITFDVEDAVDDSGTSTNRITAPDSGDLFTGTFDDSTKTIPGTDLLVGSACGIWLKLNVPAGTNPLNTYFEFLTSGATT